MNKVKVHLTSIVYPAGTYLDLEEEKGDKIMILDKYRVLFLTHSPNKILLDSVENKHSDRGNLIGNEIQLLIYYTDGKKYTFCDYKLSKKSSDDRNIECLFGTAASIQN